MTCSVVVTTYNWEAALALVLEGLARQRVQPCEVIVADDGSGAATRDLVATRARDFPCPLRHVWQEDLGFRAARVRNLAIAAAQGDYVILLDGDMVPAPDFVGDHRDAARPGCFVQGSRVLAGAAASAGLLASGRTRMHFFERGIDRRRHTLRWPGLSRVLRRPNTSPAGVKTCNQGWWRSDLLRLNGFDERMQGWGREDDELAARAFNDGMRKITLKFAGNAVHLHHRERHLDAASPNEAILRDTRASGRTRCERGIAQAAGGSA